MTSAPRQNPGPTPPIDPTAAPQSPGNTSAPALKTESTPSPARSAKSTWPNLPMDEIDRGWQQAINDGPATIGRQIAYALAVSNHQSRVDAPPDTTHRPGAGQLHNTNHAGLITLTAFGKHLSMPERLTLLEEAQGVDDPTVQARALLALAPHLAGDNRRQTLRTAYDSTLQVTDPAERAWLFITLLPQIRQSVDIDLPSGIVAETLDLAGGIHDVEARLRSLTALAQYLPPTVRIALLLAVLDNIATMSNADSQAGALIALTPHLLGEVHHRVLTVAAHIPDPAARARALTVLAQHLPPALHPRLQAAALEAIATIDHEMERAGALASFAPYLDSVDEDSEAFPVLLERALALAVAMNRRDARARALVGLQARLPRNLQGEALAAVNTISDEHVRAQMLADLAESLPVDMAVGALAVAHNIRQRDARFLALKALGRRLDGNAAERTWLDALAVAVALPRQLERVLALAELAPNLPDDLRNRTLSNALTTARSIMKERARVRALSTLAPLLADHQQLLADALADAYTLTSAIEKASALTALVPYLPDGATTDRTIDVVLEDLQEITVEYRRARALASLAPYLQGPQLKQALTIAEQVSDPYDKATTLIALLPQLPEAERADPLQTIRDSAGEITDHYDQATALAALWPLAATATQREIAREVLNAVTEIEDEYDRASGISVFAPLLAAEDMPSVLPPESQVLRDALLATCNLNAAPERAAAFSMLLPSWQAVHPQQVAYALWCEVLVKLCRRPLPDLFSDIAVLHPVIEHLGGKDAARQAIQAVATARIWRPNNNRASE